MKFTDNLASIKFAKFVLDFKTVQCADFMYDNPPKSIC